MDGSNAAAACGECNRAKHNHTAAGFVAACRHLATRAGLGRFGLHPEAFRDCRAPKARSGSLPPPSTHRPKSLPTVPHWRAAALPVQAGGGGVRPCVTRTRPP